MPKKLKVVLDTNVLVSASFRKVSPIPNKIYQALKSQKFIPVVSHDVLEEVADVIHRDYIIARTRMTESDRTAFIEVIKSASIVTSGQTVLKKVSRDSKDNKFLACASEAEADYIVTGDKDLLVLGNYGKTKIITPKEFVELLE